MSSDVKCQECGGPTALHARWGTPLKFCSKLCASKFNQRAARRRKAEGTPPRTCDECGAVMESEVRVGAPRRFCSETCKTRYHNRRSRRRRLPLRNPSPEPRPCAHCGKLFVPINRNRIYCYGICGQLAYQKRKREGAPPRMVKREVRCDGCGEMFTAVHPNARWCSTRCHRRHWSLVQSRQRGALSAADYSDLEVFERDNWTCHLCGGAVDPDLSRSDLLGATIDHIVPISLGGLDTIENVATAHRSCNRRKAATLLNTS